MYHGLPSRSAWGLGAAHSPSSPASDETKTERFVGTKRRGMTATRSRCGI